MQLLISGAGGLIGRQLVSRLRASGHQTQALVRDGPHGNPSRADAGGVPWQPGRVLDPALLGSFDVVVHLAGRPVATLWTQKAKAEIESSRVQGTLTLATAVAESFRRTGRPRALVCSSAIGYYGSRGDEELDEHSEPGIGFLAEVCQRWEQAASPAAMAGVRVAHMRTSLVLSPEGGALAKMLTPFRMGLGGRLGSGHQWWSWVSLNDAARAFSFAVEKERIHGPVNLAAPFAVTNQEFTRILAHRLHRPAIFPVPAWVLRLLAGEMAEEMLLASQKVLPQQLVAAGFSFEDQELEACLARLLR